MADHCHSETTSSTGHRSFPCHSESPSPEVIPEEVAGTFKERIKNLRKIHGKILQCEEMFVEHRKKWEAASSYEKSEFFIKRCHWEEDFKNRHFLPLYEERREALKANKSFWGIAMKNNKILHKQIDKGDDDALRFLTDIRSRRTANFKGFQLDFIFDDNPYFKNEVLTKKYELTGDDESTTLTITGTDINWYGRKRSTRNSKKRSIGSYGFEAPARRKSSFFNYFDMQTHQASVSFNEYADKLEGTIPCDYAIGVLIRDSIIPHAISWFMGDEQDKML